MSDKVLVGLIISTLCIKELWKIEPESEQVYKLFQYSEVLITKQTYYWFFCYHAIQLIIVRVWYCKFAEYAIVFSIWFIFQILEVIEYYLTYNEPHLFIQSYGITILKLKYIAVVTSLIIKLCKK